jgi:Do/DeqQ family serine protease
MFQRLEILRIVVTSAALALAVPSFGALPATDGTTPMPTLAPMIKRVSPAVVNIATRGTVKERTPQNPLLEDPFFRRFFDIPDMGPRERQFQSAGSGVIFDAKNGYIVTNAHVVDNATEITVTLQDGRDLTATVVGSDVPSDVAVLKVPTENLIQVALGDSTRLEVGDFVVAIGNPFGLQHTVTSGIVSGLGRSGINPDGYEDFIQTDASINPGNSGGALVNLNGELVGINTASFNPRGAIAGNIGLGFAIPANLAHTIAEQLIGNKGVVRRGTFGLETQDLTGAIARGLGISADGGAVVARVFPNSAAAQAGLRTGDVITAANGQRIDGRDALRNFEGLQTLGSRVTLDVLRDGKPMKLQIGLTEQPRAVAGGDVDPRLAGATFVEVPASLRNAGLSGVLVESVARGSRAAQNGLRAGDVVIASTAGAFDDLAAFRAGFTRQPADLALRIMRGNQLGILPMR